MLYLEKKEIKRSYEHLRTQPSNERLLKNIVKGQKILNRINKK